MTTAPRALATLLLLGLAAACAGNPSPDATDPETLGVISARIHAEPARADEILAENGLTAEEHERRVWDVAEDPELAERYTRAMEEELERQGVGAEGGS